ncbi:MAG: hypothetical protein QM736_25255 [Vicinamibacterales bacterium]
MADIRSHLHDQTHTGTAHKRDAALALLDACGRSLAEVRSIGDAREIADRARTEIIRLQGQPDDRPYLMKTLCQLAHLLRSYGWSTLAADLLESAATDGIVDAYVLSELVQCQLRRGDAAAAESTLDRARQSGLLTDAICTSIIAAHGRAGDVASAERVYQQALADGVVSEFVFTAMIAVYGKAGQPTRARDLRSGIAARVPQRRLLHRAHRRLRARRYSRRRAPHLRRGDAGGTRGSTCLHSAPARVPRRRAVSAWRVRCSRRRVPRIWTTTGSMRRSSRRR